MIETKLNGKTPDIAEENIAKLKEIFPDVFCEGKVDFEKLQQVLGNYIEDENERYNFSWNGKGRSLRLAQSPSTGTLRPCKEESKDWETTENLYIEGDNLEVLKLLQKSYHNKIKMIYIDPPYNTGHDFVYPDDYRDNIQNYLELTGQVDSDGKKISTNSEASGRYHTDWLNMMYPRLRLARNLLTEDGVIFISIDDNEQCNMKKLCDEIFNEDNFISTLAVENNPKGRKNNAFIAESYEYCLIYAKDKSNIYNILSKTNRKKFFKGVPNIEDTRRTFVDEYGEFKQSKRQVSGIGKSNSWARVSNPERCFTIYYKKDSKEKMELINEYSRELDEWTISPTGEKLLKDGYIRYCCLNNIDMKPAIPLYSKETLYQMFEEHKLYFKDDGTIYEKDRDNSQQITSILTNKKFGLDLMTESATAKMEELFGVKDIFTNSKAIDFIKSMINLYPENELYILDFFSGSATTAHAVMQLNAEDGGNRKFICVQLPEPCDEKSEAFKAGYKNICEIGKERIRRAGEKINSEIIESDKQITFDGEERKLVDVGFKVLKLDTSNIKRWNPDFENIERTLLDNVDNLVEGRNELDLVYEIMLKYGLNLTYPVKELSCGDKKVYSIGFGMLVICVAEDISLDVAKFIVDYKKQNNIEEMRVVFKDSSFDNNDSLKTNTKEILKVAGVEEFITM